MNLHWYFNPPELVNLSEELPNKLNFLKKKKKKQISLKRTVDLIRTNK